MAFVERLKKQLREVDTLASLGNDVFAILLEDVKSPDDAKLVAIRLHAELDLPYLVNEKEESLSVNIRIVPNIHIQENIDNILESIDQQVPIDPFDGTS